MKNVFAAGIGIGVVCALWQLIMGYAGWYKHPSLHNLFWVVIAIQIAFLFWGLSKTANEGNTYWPQVGAGTLMSLVAAVLLFCFSFLFTSLLFPQYFEEMRAMQTEIWKQAGRSEAEIKTLLSLAAKTETSLFAALSGAIGTVVTGFVVSLLIGAFARRRGD